MVLYSVLSGLVIWSGDLLVKYHQTRPLDQIKHCIISYTSITFRLVWWSGLVIWSGDLVLKFYTVTLIRAWFGLTVYAFPRHDHAKCEHFVMIFWDGRDPSRFGTPLVWRGSNAVQISANQSSLLISHHQIVIANWHYSVPSGAMRRSDESYSITFHGMAWYFTPVWEHICNHMFEYTYICIMDSK